MLRRSLATSTLVVLLLLGMGFATTLSPIAAAATSNSSFGSASGSAMGSIGTPVIAPWSNPAALVRFKGDQVILTLNGITRVVAHDDRQRLDPVFAQLATVSPDSRWLLYVTAQNEGWQNAALTRVNLTTLQRQVLATIPANFWPQLRWSPDSKQIAYPVFNPRTGRPEIYVMDVTGAQNRRVIASPTLTRTSLTGTAQATFGWMSNGRSLIYYNNALAPRIAYTVSVATGKQIAQQSVTPFAITGPMIASTPCNAPIFTQTDSRWANDIMQTANQTIGNDGCALTAATMNADYYGSSQEDPGTMNSCIGDGADPFTWGDLPGCSNNTSWFQEDSFSWSTLNSELNAGHPIILGVTWNSGGTHFVLVVAGDGSDNPANYLINDPEYSTRQTLTTIAANAQLDWLMIYHPVSGSWPPCVTGGSSSTVHNDFLGNGRSDSLAFYNYSSNTTAAYEWDSNGNDTFTYHSQVWGPTSGFDYTKAKWVTGDFLGNGRTDVVAFYNYGTDEIAAYEWDSNGNDTFTYHSQVWGPTSGLDWNQAKFVSGDFLGNGRDDVLAFYNYGTDETAAYEWDSNGNDTFTYQGLVWGPVSGFDWTKAQWITGDFTGNGRDDAVAFYNYAAGTTAAYEWDSNGNDTYTYHSQIWGPTSGFDWTKAQWVSGDFNGDGISDAVAFYNYGTDEIMAYEWDGTGHDSFNYHSQIWGPTSGYNWTLSTWIP